MSSDEGSYQVRRTVLGQSVGGSGLTERLLRMGAMAAGAGDLTSVGEPYDSVSRQIGEAAYQVTDEQVAAVRSATGSDKAAFEIVFAASVGAGLKRWDAAYKAIEGLDDAVS